jgi:hypothetical protein
MRYIFAFLSWAFAVAPLCAQQAQQQQKINVYQIQDNFIAVAVVFDRCGANDPDLKFKFSTNLRAISIWVAKQAREEHPDQPDPVLAKALEDRVKAVEALTTKALNIAGCDSDYAKKMLKLYEFHANWNMYARPNP